MSARENKKPTQAMKLGDRVIVRRNPHDLRCENVVGTVVRFCAGAGFGGCDLVDIQYENPLDQLKYTLPFTTDALELATAVELVLLAERHERQAAAMRDLANALGCKQRV